MTLVVPEQLIGVLIVLRRYVVGDAPDVKASIAASFDELHEWMPFAQDPPTDESALEFVQRSAVSFGGAEPANLAITLKADGTFVGSCGLMPRDEPDSLEIGYWVDSRYTGRGIATEAARLLTSAAFGIDGVKRVQISCDEANVRSAAVPRRLGYTLDRLVDSEKYAAADSGRTMVWGIERDAWKQ